MRTVSHPSPDLPGVEGAARLGQRQERRRSALTQRELTRTMKAAKAAGIGSFDLVDPGTGLIFRARAVGQQATETDLDDELRAFQVKLRG